MEQEPVTSPPVDSSPLVPGPRGLGSRRVALVAGVPLLLVGIAAAVAGSVSGIVVGVLAAWFVTTARQKLVLSDRQLVVQGRLTRRRVDLVSLQQAHEDKAGCVWVAGRDQRPFRIYFVPGGEPGPSTVNGRLFVAELLRRSAAVGAPVDRDAPLGAPAPGNTSTLFSL